MKKIIRLTESDLARIVRRVIKESEPVRRNRINESKVGDMLSTSPDYKLATKFFSNSWNNGDTQPIYSGTDLLIFANQATDTKKSFRYNLAVYKILPVRYKNGSAVVPVFLGLTSFEERTRTLENIKLEMGSNFSQFMLTPQEVNDAYSSVSPNISAQVPTLKTTPEGQRFIQTQLAWTGLPQFKSQLKGTALTVYTALLG